MDEKGSRGGGRDILCFGGTSVGEHLFVCKAPSLLYIFVTNIVAVSDLLDSRVHGNMCPSFTCPCGDLVSAACGARQ